MSGIGGPNPFQSTTTGTPVDQQAITKEGQQKEGVQTLTETAAKTGSAALETVGVGGSSEVHPISKSQLPTASETPTTEMAQKGVETAAARFKAGSPGFAFQNQDQTAVYRSSILERVNTDKADMKACIEGGHIGTLRNGPVVSRACSQLMHANRELFCDKEKFQQKWQAFLQSPQGQSCSSDLKGPPPEMKDLSPTGELSAKGYHNEYHANEMYADTVVKLHREGVDESLCVAGGTMAYFHDLVQGLDGFPGLGKNENVTAKFLNFLIDEQVASGEIDENTGQALQSLSDATIVGGTFLVGVVIPPEKEGEKSTGKNQTPSECVDSSDLKTTGHEQDYEDLSKIRHMMARNDISRTQEPDYTKRPDKQGVDESTPQGKMIGSCYDAKAEAFDRRSQEIESNPAFQKLGLPPQQFARVCQSIRMLTEILPKVPGSTFNEKSVVDHMRNGLPPDSNYDASLKMMIGKLKDPVTWSGGMKGDRFVPGEAQFAKPSGHDAYADAISSQTFKESLASLGDDDMEQLIECALSGIQDGKYIGESLQRTD